jgi:hypothetical protein
VEEFALVFPCGRVAGGGMLRRGLRAGLDAVWATVQGSGRLAEAATLDTFWQRPWLWGPQQRCLRQQTSLRGRVGARPSGLGAAGCWGRRSRAPADALGDGARFMSPATGECASSRTTWSGRAGRPQHPAVQDAFARCSQVTGGADATGTARFAQRAHCKRKRSVAGGAVAVRAGSSHRR